MVNHTDPFRMDNKNTVEPKGRIDRPNVATKPEESCGLSIQEEVEVTHTSHLRVGLTFNIIFVPSTG